MGSVDVPIEFINGCEWHRLFWQWDEGKYALRSNNQLVAYRCGLGTPGQPTVLGQRTKKEKKQRGEGSSIFHTTFRKAWSHEPPEQPQEKPPPDDIGPDIILDTPQSPSHATKSPVEDQPASPKEKGKGKAQGPDETSAKEQRTNLLEEYQRIQHTLEEWEEGEDTVMEDLWQRGNELYNLLYPDEETIAYDDEERVHMCVHCAQPNHLSESCWQPHQSCLRENARYCLVSPKHTHFLSHLDRDCPSGGTKPAQKEFVLPDDLPTLMEQDVLPSLDAIIARSEEDHMDDEQTPKSITDHESSLGPKSASKMSHSSSSE